MVTKDSQWDPGCCRNKDLPLRTSPSGLHSPAAQSPALLRICLTGENGLCILWERMGETERTHSTLRCCQHGDIQKQDADQNESYESSSHRLFLWQPSD